ncbi:MAG: osmotically inducible protein OsmC [Anaerolineaceae bacterium]|nr:MAG: osmotically inducible protein OsmC [Anaerolineaceae bacterium]
MDAKVTWKGKLAFEAIADTGRTIMLDSSADPKGFGPAPMELIAMSMAGCTAMDVISILEKKKQDVTNFEVKVHAERAEDYPKVYTRAELIYEVTGRELDESAVLRAIELSVQKYCPVHAMLSQVFPISQRYVIFEDEGNGVRRQVAEGTYMAE